MYIFIVFIHDVLINVTSAERLKSTAADAKRLSSVLVESSCCPRAERAAACRSDWNQSRYAFKTMSSSEELIFGRDTDLLFGFLQITFSGQHCRLQLPLGQSHRWWWGAGLMYPLVYRLPA